MESSNTFTPKQFLLYQHSCNSFFLLQGLWGGGTFAIIQASLALRASCFSAFKVVRSVTARYACWKHQQESCANGITCAMETACARRYICALSDFKASITSIMEICITEWIQAYLTSRQNELPEVKCATASPTSNSSHCYLLWQEQSWLQVDFGVSVQSPRRSLTVTDFVMTLTHKEVNTFLLKLMLWIVRGHAQTCLAFLLHYVNYALLNISAFVNFCHAIISLNSISTVAYLKRQYLIWSS